MLVEACSGQDGRVQSVQHLGGGEPTVNTVAGALVRKMAFRPRSAPFCQPMQLVLQWVPASERKPKARPAMLMTAVARGLCVSCPEPGAPGTRLILKVCVAETGLVSHVQKMRSPTDAPHVLETVRQWKFQPYVVDDEPWPFCFSEIFR